MKEIKLTQGKVAIVDDEDFEFLSQWKWYVHGSGPRTCYAERKSEGDHKRVPMHRVIMNTPKGLFTDHINGNGLDNRRCNLRICTTAENQYNARRRHSNRSGFKGVYYDKAVGKWRAAITINQKKIHLGRKDTPQEAHQLYVEAAKKHFGEFARFE